MLGDSCGAVEIRRVAGETLDAIIDGAVGMDDEFPVTGLKKQKLAGCADHHFLDLRIGFPGDGVEEAEERAFSTVFDFPHPAIAVVDPDAVVALLAPASFG